ncbi:ArsR/SmtB family transcription factor [Poseidonocella pacifica]|uniref:ArsR/SmtB family transcription factor n=1 Tax=Poseidonocella pacifica TaxID=871651 RepID=UPI001C319E41|nr:metalloregulator ArsR/SmtB family transcription factor [Poseidonocella pacifica]
MAGALADKGRVSMLISLLGEGTRRTATELAEVAGVSPPTASNHLAKLTDAGLLERTREGRRCYFTIASNGVVGALDALMAISEPIEGVDLPMDDGAAERAMSVARSCYGHLAGALGEQVFKSLEARNAFAEGPSGMELTPRGRAILTAQGLDIDKLSRAHKGEACRPCAERTPEASHLGGYIARGLLDIMLARGWAVADEKGRALHFSEEGRAALDRSFPPIEG